MCSTGEYKSRLAKPWKQKSERAQDCSREVLPCGERRIPVKSQTIYCKWNTGQEKMGINNLVKMSLKTYFFQCSAIVGQFWNQQEKDSPEGPLLFWTEDPLQFIS